MKAFLDVGALLFVILGVYAVASWALPLPQIGPFWGIRLGFLAIPMGWFVMHTLWHMLSRRHWYWFMASLVLAPITLVAYYVGVSRKDLAHAAQQGAPGDVPRPAGSGRA